MEEHLFNNNNLKEMFSCSVIDLKENLLEKGSLIDTLRKNQKIDEDGSIFKSQQ